MKAPHLTAGLAALLLGAAAATGWYVQARWLETRSIHFVAPRMFPLKNQGSALQREALRQPDLLLVYGSSELGMTDPYQANELFRDYPTGFTIFPVGQMGTSSLILLQKVASLSADLPGKRIVLTLTPPTFFRKMIEAETYAGNFSPLQASELAFSTDLSMKLKQAAAQRMLEYPGTLNAYPLLEFALRNLASDSVASRGLYYVTLPLGKLHTFILRLQDHRLTAEYIQEQPDLREPPRRPGRPPDWASLLVQAERDYRRRASNNVFGFDNDYWEKNASGLTKRQTANPSASLPIVRAISSSPQWLQEGKEWLDLKLVLQSLHELNAQSLLLSAPLNGAFYDYWGVPYEKRLGYYAKLRTLAQRHGAAVADFADHDGDPYFGSDAASHLSSKGWVYFAEALDAFYHLAGDSQVLRTTLPSGPERAPDTPHAPMPCYEGSHVVTGPVVIAGWAWDAAQPNQAISVDIYDGRARLATVPADSFGPDLLKAGKGNGYHRFVFPIPESLKDGKSHSVRVTIAGTDVNLTNTPRSISFATRSPRKFEGRHELTGPAVIAGWAWDAVQPNKAISVDIYDGTTCLATVSADKFGPDLVKAGKGNGYHRFVYPVPVSLRDGRSHKIRVTFSGTELGLQNTPKTLLTPTD